MFSLHTFKFFFFTILAIFLYITYELIFNKNLIIKNLIEYLILNKDNYILIIIVNLIYFLTPLPVTPMILFNGFFYGHLGFFIIDPMMKLSFILVHVHHIH